MTGRRSRRRNPRPFVPPRIGTPRDPDARTLGPQVAEVSARMGKPFMPHQQHVMNVGLELRPDGRLKYDEVVWTIMRQAGKTTGVRAKKVWRCTAGQYRFGTDQVALYLAQTRGAARKKLERDFAPGLRVASADGSYVEIPQQGRRKPETPTEWKLSMNNGQEHIAFGPSSFLQIDAPNREAGHGDTIDDATLDEAFAHQGDDVEQAIEGTTLSRADAQLWVVSTAGDEKSLYLYRKVRDGRRLVRSGVESNVCYLEWSLPDDADIDDEVAWWEFLPALGRTIDIDTLRRRLEKARQRDDENGEDVFRRTILNQWVRRPVLDDDDRPRPVDHDVWSHRYEPKARHVGSIALGVDTSPAHRTVYLTVAGPARDGRHLVEVIHEQYGSSGIETFIDQAIERYAPVAVAWNHGGDTRRLSPRIVRAVDDRADLVRLSGGEWAAACSEFVAAIDENRICHLGQDWLDDAVLGATKKYRGDAWVFDMLTADADVAPLCAATAAHRAIESHRPEDEDEDFYAY